MKRRIQLMQDAAKTTKILNQNVGANTIGNSIESITNNSKRGVRDARHLTARKCEQRSTVCGGSLAQKWHELHNNEVMKKLSESKDDTKNIFHSKIIARNILAINTGKIRSEESVKKVDYHADKNPNKTVCELKKVAEKLYVQKTYQPEKIKDHKVRPVNKALLYPEMSANLRKINSDSKLLRSNETKTKMESAWPLRKAQSTFPLASSTARYKYGHYCNHCTMMSNIRLKTPRQKSEFKAAINPESFEFSEKLFGTIKTQ